MPSHPNISQPAHPEEDEATLTMISDIWDNRHILRMIAAFCGAGAAPWREGHTAPRELAQGCKIKRRHRRTTARTRGTHSWRGLPTRRKYMLVAG